MSGFTSESLIDHLDGLPIVGLGFVADIERQGKAQYEALLQECERMCSIAESIGCRSVLLVTGPLAAGAGENPMYKGEVSSPYEGLINKSWPEIRNLTAKNLHVLSEIGKRHQVEFYLESLSLTPLHTLEQTLELLNEAAVENVGLIIDFWHQFTSGTTPDQIARLDGNLI